MDKLEGRSSSSSLHGLNFGKKVYFEDGGGGSSSTAAAGGGPRKGKGALQEPPRCQVQGCNVDLTDAKPYYSRHKVCGMHSKSPKVFVAGLEQRFCQQCSRFHLLSEFDQGKRSCRRRLAGHNERRRKPPPGPSSTRFGRFAASYPEDDSRFRGFLMDFSYPRQQSTPRAMWPTVRARERPIPPNSLQGALDNNTLHGVLTSHGSQQYLQGPSGAPLFPALGIPGEYHAGDSDSSCALSLLSTQQPWTGAAATRARAMNMSMVGSFDGEHMVPLGVVPNAYPSHSWGFRGSEHGMQHASGLGLVNQSEGGQFSGELELALQGDRQIMNIDPGRRYNHPHPQDVPSGHSRLWG